MATINRGILDGFFGKVGTVVGSFWKGIPVMRAYVRRIRDRKNSPQLLIRARFATLGELSSAFLAATRIGMRNAAAKSRTTESNVFVNKNWSAVEADSVDSVTVDFASLVVAHGPLTGVQFGSPQFDTPQQVDVSFDTNEEIDKTSLDDLVYLFAYCPDAKCGVLSPAVKRSDKSVSVTVPAYWNGMKVHLWGFTLGDGLDNKGMLSNSVYIGSGDIG